MPTTTCLRDVADIKTGYTFRKAVSLYQSTGLKGLLISDVRHSKVIDPRKLGDIQWDGRGTPPLLESGDVVLVAKGDQNYAAIFRDNENKVVPSSQFLVLTVKATEKLSPEFLCWLLNYPDIQKKLAEFQVGTKIYSISKKSLQSLQVPLPSREIQQKLLHMETLMDQEIRLTHALLKNRERMVHGISKKLLLGETQ